MNLHVHIWDYEANENDPIEELDVPVTGIYEWEDEYGRPEPGSHVQFSFRLVDVKRDIEIRVPIEWLTLKAFREATE